MSIATDKRGYPHIIFLLLDENICCGYSSEAPRRGASDEYPQHVFGEKKERYQHFSDEKSALSVAMYVYNIHTSRLGEYPVTHFSYFFIKIYVVGTL